MNYPKFFRVRLIFDAPKVDSVEKTLDRELGSHKIHSQIKAGARIAITVGSRGIANIVPILKHLVHILKDHSAEPFILPAMGSHGGGTAEGQREILKKLKITEDSIGAPILSSMRVVEIGKSSFGFPVLVDRYAAEADGIVVLNRIRPHTEFEGSVESGLLKMMAIGMGNHKGCFEVHKQTVNYGYRAAIIEIGSLILKKLPVLFGVAILENVYDETALIHAIQPSQFMIEEKKILAKAKEMMARLPFKTLDVLIVDEMGKNISGTGMDTNVIGRIMFIGEKEPEYPKITRIVVFDLTEESQGNAIGIGLADFTTQRLINKMDSEATSLNAITAMTPEKGRIPIVLKNDKKAVEAAISTIGTVNTKEARVVHIKNTLEMAEFDVSESLLEEVKKNKNIQIREDSGTLSFDKQGNLRRIFF